MQLEDIERIGDYVMPERPAVRSDLALIFGTRHGVEDFCQAVVTLWHKRMFRKAVVSGGMTAGLHDSEAETMATRLMELGIPEHVLIIEPFAMNTGAAAGYRGHAAASCPPGHAACSPSQPLCRRSRSARRLSHA